MAFDLNHFACSNICLLVTYFFFPEQFFRPKKKKKRFRLVSVCFFVGGCMVPPVDGWNIIVVR
jgi:hypothetical protein